MLALRLSADLACPTSPRSEASTPRTPRSPLLVSCAAPTPRISRRQWRTPPPHGHAAAEQAPAGARGAGPGAPSASYVPGGVEVAAEAQPDPQHECSDVSSQILAASLTVDEYRAAQLAGDGLLSQGGGALPAGGAALPSASHLSLSSADVDGMELCSHCRYPCHLSGMPTCEAAHYLQMWDADGPLKPRGFDAAAALRVQGVADIAAVSSGGRANGRWKPDNQDAFLVQPTPAAAATAEGPAAGTDVQPGAAAALGVFDGHGRLGATAAAIARRAMSEQLAAPLRGGDVEPRAADLLRGCFDAAAAALEASGKDFSKSGCAAVLALVGRDGLSVGWAGDSRAVLGVCGGPPPAAPAPPHATSTAAGCAAVMAAGAFPSASSGSFDLAAPPACAAVPLTEDHKPDRPSEQERIAAAGGRVARIATDRGGNPIGPFRVFAPGSWTPGLALSRALGDTLASSVGVTSQPEVTILPLLPPPAPTQAPQTSTAVSNAAAASCCSSDSGTQAGACPDRHILIVASDGLWEWVSNAAAVGIAACAATAEDAAHALVEAAQKQWAVRYRGRNCDDITVVVAFLHR